MASKRKLDLNQLLSKYEGVSNSNQQSRWKERTYQEPTNDANFND